MEPHFYTKLIVSKLNDELWKVERPLQYASKFLGAIVVVPEGFVTDFASVPRFPPIVFALCGDSAHEAAVIHDFLYQTHLCGTRSRADQVFLEAMETTGIGWLKRRTMYMGVRVGGVFSWNSGPERFTVLNERLEFERPEK